LYFLLILTDARKLRSRMLKSEDDPRLIASDYPAWMAHPFAAPAGDNAPDDIPFRRDKLGFTGSDGLAG
jgi:hypothetical protein